MIVQNRRKYDPDFKRKAVLLSLEAERSAAQVAENLGISKELLYRWRKEYRKREELAFPGHGHLQQSAQMRFFFVENHRSSFPVKKMCHVLRVSQSGYYRDPSPPQGNHESQAG